MTDPDDEIVLTMSKREYDLLRGALVLVFHRPDGSPRPDAIEQLINRVTHNAETLTLSWLDRKLQEFP